MTVSTKLLFFVAAANIFSLGNSFGIFPFSGLNSINDLLHFGEHFPNLQQDIEKLSENGGLDQFRLGEKNEDLHLNFTQLVKKYGYEVEVHQIQTEDGYRMRLYRIPGKGESVLLMHGLLNSAVDWLAMGPGRALPYMLADAGYDVWLGNARAAEIDSQEHAFLDVQRDADRYWDFSWHEIGCYDLPAIIDRILETSGQSQIKYVGHSQGTTSVFVMGSQRPEYSNKISMVVALSAVAWMSHLESPLIRLVAPAAGTFAEVIRNVIGVRNISPDNPLVTILTNIICGDTELATLICSNIMFSLSGFNYAQLNVTNMPNIFAHTPGGVSTKQVLHYAHGINSGKFRQYDYGPIKNIAVYGLPEPPQYNVEDIKTKIAIFYRKKGDWLAGYEDVLKLRRMLPNVVDFYEVPFENFCHTDFIWAKDVDKLVNNRILKLFAKYKM